MRRGMRSSFIKCKVLFNRHYCFLAIVQFPTASMGLMGATKQPMIWGMSFSATCPLRVHTKSLILYFPRILTFKKVYSILSHFYCYLFILRISLSLISKATLGEMGGRGISVKPTDPSTQSDSISNIPYPYPASPSPHPRPLLLVFTEKAGKGNKSYNPDTTVSYRHASFYTMDGFMGSQVTC